MIVFTFTQEMFKLKKKKCFNLVKKCKANLYNYTTKTVVQSHKYFKLMKCTYNILRTVKVIQI